MPEPPVQVWPEVDLDGEYLVFGVREYRYEQAAGELYLRDAADVDIDSAADILAFTRKHGRLAPMHLPGTDLPGTHDSIVSAISLHAQEHGRRYGRTVSALRVHVDEVGYRLRVLQQLRRHVLAHAAGDWERDVWPPVPPAIDPQWAAWDRFTSLMNAGLQPFHVRVWLDDDDPDKAIGAPRPSLYEVAVLQIANHLAADVDYKVCPHCQRPFVRQIGRSQHYSRSRGVSFCSKSCSSAAGVKAYRQRQRAAKSTNGEGDEHGER